MSSLGIRGFTYEDGRLILPQWRMRPLGGANLAIGPVVPVDTYAEVFNEGDANVVYIRYNHNSGVAKQITYRATVDGTQYVGTFLALVATTYYVFLDTDTDTLDEGVNIILAGRDVPWYGQSFVIEFQGAGLAPYIIDTKVRYQSL